MMKLILSSAQEHFFQVFFGSGNLCSLDLIYGEGPKNQSRIRPWVDRMIGESSKETVLPFVNRKTKEVVWYGLAFSTSQFNRLGELLSDFIGPSHSTFEKQRAKLSESDVIDRAVQVLTNGWAYRFTADNDSIWIKLELMRHVMEEKPSLGKEPPRLTGRILRDFYEALKIGNREAAQSHLQDIREKNLVSVPNGLFLQVQMLESFNEWAEIVRMPEFPQLLEMNTPDQVANVLKRAVQFHRE